MKQLICSKLLDLMETQHYETIKVTDLVKYIGIGRSTFYSHFDSIYSVPQTIEDEFINGLPVPDANIRDVLINDRKIKIDYLNHLKNNKKAYLVLNSSNGDPSVCGLATIPAGFCSLPLVPSLPAPIPPPNGGLSMSSIREETTGWSPGGWSMWTTSASTTWLS